jgi:hypothetical protein
MNAHENLVMKFDPLVVARRKESFAGKRRSRIDVTGSLARKRRSYVIRNELSWKHTLDNRKRRNRFTILK